MKIGSRFPSSEYLRFVPGAGRLQVQMVSRCRREMITDKYEYNKKTAVQDVLKILFCKYKIIEVPIQYVHWEFALSRQPPTAGYNYWKIAYSQ